MKVKLLKEWIGKPIGTEIELEDAKAERLIKTGLVEKATIVAVAKKRVKKESVSFNPRGI